MMRFTTLFLVLGLLTATAYAKPKKARKPAPAPSASADPSRPFAAQGYLECPPGRDIRMGFANAQLTILARGGSLIRRQQKSLNLERGRLGVSMGSDGRAAIRLLAGPLAIETKGGKLVLERADTTRLQVLEGSVQVAGAGAPRTLEAGQQLELDAGGRALTGKVPAQDRASGLSWLQSK